MQVSSVMPYNMPMQNNPTTRPNGDTDGDRQSSQVKGPDSDRQPTQVNKTEVNKTEVNLMDHHPHEVGFKVASSTPRSHRIIDVYA